MEHLIVEQTGRVLCLKLNRPERRNAMTAAMYSQLADQLEAANSDPEIRAICLSGEGKGFCAGNDLGDFMAAGGLEGDPPVVRFLRLLSSCEVPLVAAVHGAAVGIGTTALLHCDLVYAAPSTRFSLPFVNLGLAPEAASSLLLPRIMGHVRAAELILLGEPFSASKALQYGLINEVVEEADLFARALAAAQSLASKPPESLRISRSLLKRASQAEVQDAMEQELQLFGALLQGPEAKEAFTAFFEKRAPNFDNLS
jgi:enoyl-CoA hydratase/carnithine racemase